MTLQMSGNRISYSKHFYGFHGTDGSPHRKENSHTIL